MWMVFNGVGALVTTNGMLGSAASSFSSLSFVNGVISVGTEDGLFTVNFLDESGLFQNNLVSRPYLGSISGRNAGEGCGADTGFPIVNRTVKDVAMTVLPDAPIDAATGLPVPTIAVATANGVSVIKDDGTVVDSASTSITLFLSFSDEGLWYGYDTSFSFATNADFLEGDGFGDITASTNGNYALDLKIRWRKEMFTFGDTLVGGGGLTPRQGFEQFSLDYDDFPNSMKSETTSTFNTGWQQGDIKGAFLSSTDTTSLVGGAELVTNGTFDANTTGWTPKNANTTLSVVSNQLSVSTDGEAGYAYQVITTVAGQAYRLTADADETTGASYASIFVGSAVNSSNLGFHTVTGIDTGLSITFVATSTTTYITLVNTRTTPVSYALFDNISVVAADADRSVNDNGLTANGTITKTPVATGADLVGYSGFSSSNYLEQPYNPDLDFGTGDFCVMGWFKTAINAAALLLRETTFNGGSGFGMYLTGGQIAYMCGSSAAVTDGKSYNDDTWKHVVLLRKSGTAYVYVNGALIFSSSKPNTVTDATASVRIGLKHNDLDGFLTGSLALWRISGTAPTAEQIAKIYNDEKVLFQENAQATLYGSSDAVTALAHDSDTDLLHVGTSAGRSVFQGLRRVSNTTTAVGTAISASNNLIVEE